MKEKYKRKASQDYNTDIFKEDWLPNIYMKYIVGEQYDEIAQISFDFKVQVLCLKAQGLNLIF